MFDPLVSLLYIAAFFALFFGTVPLAVAILRGDRERVDRVLDMYLDVFAAIMSAIVGMLRVFRRKEQPPALPPGDTKTITK